MEFRKNQEIESENSSQTRRTINTAIQHSPIEWSAENQKEKKPQTTVQDAPIHGDRRRARTKKMVSQIYISEQFNARR